MGTEIITSTATDWSTLRPSGMDPSLRARLSILKSRITLDEPKGFHLKDAPTRADRDALERRQGHLLREWMTGCDAKTLSLTLIDFLEDYPANHHLDDAAAEKLLQKYVTLFAGAPKWALDAVIRKFRAGHGDQRFTPTVPEMMWLLQAELRPVENELREIEEVLNARIIADPMPSHEARSAQVEELWTNGLRSSVILAGADPIEEEEKKKAMGEEFVRVSKQQMERWQHHEGIDPGSTPHSPLLLKTFERMAKELGSAREKTSGHESEEHDRSKSA